MQDIDMRVVNWVGKSIKGIALAIICGWLTQLLSNSVLKAFSLPQNMALSTPLTFASMQYIFLYSIRGHSREDRIWRLSYDFVFLSLLFFLIAMFLYGRVASNLVPLSLALSLSITIVVETSGSAHHTIFRTKGEDGSEELIAVSNFPRLLFFRKGRKSSSISFLGGRKRTDKGLLDHLQSEFRTFPLSTEIRLKQPFLQIVSYLLSSDVAKRVTIFIRSDQNYVNATISANEYQPIEELLSLVSVPPRIDNTTKVFVSIDPAQDFVQRWNRQSPSLWINDLMVPAGILLGKWLVLCDDKRIKISDQNPSRPSHCTLFKIRLSNGSVFDDLRSGVWLNRITNNILNKPDPLKFNIYVSEHPPSKFCENWDLTLEVHDHAPADVTHYDGILFMRPAKDDEVVRLFPKGLTQFTKVLQGRRVILTKGVRPPIALDEVIHPE